MSKENNIRIGVAGSGSWATAIVKMLCENTDQVNWMVRSDYVKEYIYQEKHNPRYLTGAELDIRKLEITTNINKLVDTSDYIIIAVPSIYLHHEMRDLKSDISEKMIFSSVKGMIPEVKDVTGIYLKKKLNIKEKNIGVITGPCHAEEVALERLSYLTVAAKEEEKAKIMSRFLESKFIKTTLSDDIFGTEYGAVLKNVFAIACGIAHGLRYGDNFQAVLLSNSIREMDKFLKVIYPINRDINSSAYLGDLLVTGYSYFSRNRTLGNMVGKGYTVRSAILEMNMVAEGYYAAEITYEMAQNNNIELPIVRAVYEILYKEQSPELIFKKLCDQLS